MILAISLQLNEFTNLQDRFVSTVRSFIPSRQLTSAQGDKKELQSMLASVITIKKNEKSKNKEKEQNNDQQKLHDDGTGICHMSQSPFRILKVRALTT